MNGSHVVAAGSCQGVVTGLVEGLKLVEVDGATKRLVEDLNCRDGVGISGVALGENLKCGDRLGNRIALLPINGSEAAAVVETILRSRCAMKINQDFKTGVSSPDNRLVQERQLSLDVWVAI